jgi:hypothetical protein
MPRFCLRFSEDEIPHWSGRYSYPGEADIEERVAPTARARGYLNRDEFLTLCRWKSPRSQPLCDRNEAGAVVEVTRVALQTSNERLKIGALLTLHGVSWPTASVILHFCDQRRYPILDFRALWSLEDSRPRSYSFSFWEPYSAFLRALAERTGHSMRIVDRALWQYSRERQRRGGA